MFPKFPLMLLVASFAFVQIYTPPWANKELPLLGLDLTFNSRTPMALLEISKRPSSAALLLLFDHQESVDLRFGDCLFLSIGPMDDQSIDLIRHSQPEGYWQFNLR